MGPVLIGAKNAPQRTGPIGTNIKNPPIENISVGGERFYIVFLGTSVVEILLSENSFAKCIPS